MNYETIFQARGGPYHDAMREWPHARREDFEVPLTWAAIEPGEIVVDVPAGGGYLREYLPQKSQWFGHEPCSSFGDDGLTEDQLLLPLPWGDGFADVAMSIAGVHHLTDKRALFGEILRVLRRSGRLVLADAQVGSPVAGFLDEFVGRHNGMGHQGIYLSDATVEELEQSGFRVLRHGAVHCGWWFANRDAMGAFCRLLFDLRDIAVDDVIDAVESRLGTIERHGKVGMNWELMLVLAEPR
ncbi:MAG: methyltransferase domain-containing protein [Gammaproteobacteria bacterium]|nr:methyltransferase domain-containing protein [Gammaproteobacteria bacterium]